MSKLQDKTSADNSILAPRLHKESALDVMRAVLKAEAPRHLNFNAIIHRVIDYCSMHGLDEPNFGTCYSRLKEQVAKGRVKHDGTGYYLDRLHDDKSARLTTWLPKTFVAKIKKAETLKIAKEKGT